jgi:hypothetical protein
MIWKSNKIYFRKILSSINDNRKMFENGIVAELLWFLGGDVSSKNLEN